MDDLTELDPPAAVAALLSEAESLGFRLSCEPRTGSLLRALAASKPGGTLLELGTGVGSAWLLAGMSADARLVSVDSDGSVQEVARRHWRLWVGRICGGVRHHGNHKFAGHWHGRVRLPRSLDDPKILVGLAASKAASKGRTRTSNAVHG